MQSITHSNPTKSRILLRADFNISLDETSHRIANDERVRQVIPTIKALLASGNTITICSHLGQPAGYDGGLGLDNVAIRLQRYLPDVEVTYYDYDATKSEDDNLTEWLAASRALPPGSVALLDNLRYFAGEKKGDIEFAKKLAAFGEIYVNDAFGVSHRADASVVALAGLLPHYGGLLMKREIEMIGGLMSDPHHPFVAVIGGAKVATKLGLITKLADLADLVLVGGKLALEPGLPEHHAIVKPIDYVYGEDKNAYDIGPETIKRYTKIIASAKTVMWNGPMGKNEDPHYAIGTKAIYSSIIDNKDVVSIIGGGDTITALADASHLERITHISTGGGAMLEYIEKGSLPGIDALG